MDIIRKISLVLVIIGALNWGVAGLFKFDVVAQLTNGSTEPFARFIYILIGVSGLLNLGLLFKELRSDDREIIEV